MKLTSIKNKFFIIEKILLPLLTVVIYWIIFQRIDRGSSCDEGYYLIGYNTNQNIGWGISDFHSIVRILFNWFSYDNALELRYIRFILTIITLTFFSYSSYKYLKLNYKINNFTLPDYYSFILLSGSLSFGFASPVLYYDSIQLFIYLISFSLTFLSTIKPRKIFLFSLGFVFFFSLTNYLPSGILLIISNIAILKLHQKTNLNHISFIFIGLFASIIIYHIFIHNLDEYTIQLSSTFTNAQIGNTRHSSIQLLLSMIEFLAILFVGIVLYFLIIKAFTLILSKYKRKYIMIFLSCFSIIISYLLIRKIQSTIILIPILFLIGNSFNLKWRIYFKQYIFLFILFITPFLGIFGTNQPIESKIIFFISFWAFLFIALQSFSKSTSIIDKYYYKYLYVLFVLILYSTYGYFNKYHYYYTPNKSSYELTGLNRFNGIKVSSDQKKFILKVDSILKDNGFKPGDEMLAFEVDLITAYAVGAQIPNNLFYAQYNMTVSEKNIPSKKIKYIMLYSGSKNEFINYIKHTTWNFPGSYKEYYLGKYAINMPETMNSILYIAK